MTDTPETFSRTRARISLRLGIGQPGRFAAALAQDSPTLLSQFTHFRLAT